MKFLEKIKNIKRPLVIFTLLGLSVMLLSRPVQADLMDATVNLLSTMISWITAGVGYILVFFFKVLVGVAQFNDFTNVSTVVTGWVVVRDICNMFFILALLIIAFSTILRLNNSWKKDLPKLLMAAILINFSRTIVGLAIDASQIVMLTFVNAVAQNGGGNFAVMFDVSKYSAMGDVTNTSTANAAGLVPATKLSLLAGSIAALAAVLITTVITIVMIAALVMRIVKLWIFAILSPMPWLLSNFSKGKKYADQFWTEFTNELVAGPVLAFFMWLALTIGAQSTTIYTTPGFNDASGVSGFSTNTITSLFSDGPFQKYIIVVGFLVAGLQFASKAGGTMGEWAGQGSKWVNQGANFAKQRASRKFQDVSRVSAAKEYFKMRSAQKESARTDKIKGQAFGIAAGMGAIKSGTVGNLSNFATKQWQKFGGAQAKKLRGEAMNDRNVLNDLEKGEGIHYAALDEEMKNKQRIEFNGRTLNKFGNEWQEANPDGTATLYSESEMRSEMRNGRIEELQRSVKNKEEEAKMHESNQKMLDGAAKWGFAPIIAGLSLAGGPLAAAITGTVAKSFMSGDAGNDDKKLVAGYRNERVSKARGDMNGIDSGVVRGNLDDPSKDPYTKLASLMELMGRKDGSINDGEVARYEAELRDKYVELGGSKDGKGEAWNDKKLAGQFESLRRNYAGAQPIMSDINYSGTDPKRLEKQRLANIEAQQNFNDGTWSLNKMDTRTLMDLGGAIAAGMKTGKFISETKDMSSGKLDAVKNILEKTGGEEALHKLLLIDINKAMGKLVSLNDGGAMLKKVMGKLTGDQIKDMVRTGDSKKTTALATGLNSVDASDLSVSARTYLGNNDGQAFIRRAGVNTNFTT